MDESSALDFIGDAVPYTYFGDSHSNIGTLVLKEPATGHHVVTRIAGIWRFVASDVVAEDGTIGDALMQVLRRAAAFHSSRSNPPLAGLRPVQTMYGRSFQTEHLALTELANEQPYVMTVGEINNRYVLYQLVTDEIDFDVPFDTDGLERLPPYQSRQTIRAEQMMRILIGEFTPLFQGLRILRDLGLRSLFLHSIPPPAVDDADSERVLQHPSPARLRYKLAMFVNHIYAAVCREIGIGFIDTWRTVTDRNLLNPEYYLDGLHLNRKHAVLSVREVHRQFTALRGAS